MPPHECNWEVLLFFPPVFHLKLTIRPHHWYNTVVLIRVASGPQQWISWGILSDAVAALSVKRLDPLQVEATFTAAAPVAATGPCLFTYPATVTASLKLHCTRHSSCVNGIVLKSSWRSRFMPRQLVSGWLITDDVEIVGCIWSVARRRVILRDVGLRQVDSVCRETTAFSAALHLQPAAQRLAFLRANWKYMVSEAKRAFPGHAWLHQLT